MFSSQQLTTPQRSTKLGRNLVAKLQGTLTKTPGYGPGRNRAGSIPELGIEHGGQSDRETPEPIPNSEDKPVHVLHCTQMRELSGTADRCRAHLTSFLAKLEFIGLLFSLSNCNEIN